MMLEAAPTPCSRTGFHINSNSWWAALLGGIETGELGGLGVPQEVGEVTPAVVTVQVGGPVGSTMIRSPGLAASIALWMLPVAATWVGALPPMVTVTESTDCLPLAAVITSSPHCALEPPYCACC